ncbi:MAG: substrate-binding domain-containing protein [Fibrobacteres bacterium]|nr:substrate-binding domain-containing protein [Fibrobacterota bacterium]
MEAKFLNDLRALIRAAGSRRLPSVRALAARWKCSPTTVQGVLRKARALVWIETKSGGGSWPAGRMPAPVAPRARRTAESLAAELREEIRSGRWGGGERLPAPKHMAARHQIHPATARKAYGLLSHDGTVEKQGRAWQVSHPRRRNDAQPVLLCLGAGEKDGSLRLGSDREWDFWREIQIEAARNNLLAEIHPWSGKLPELGMRPVGAVVSTWHLPDPYPLLSALHRARLPAAVWLENPVLSPARLSIRSPWLGFHDMAYGLESGAILGDHPLIRKHGRIAWISPFHGAEWSRNRLEGMRNKLSEGTALHEALGPWVSEWDFQEAVWHDPEAWKRVRLDGVGGEARFSDLVRPLMEALGRDRLLESFSPYLEKALASRSSLWVAASDWVALACLDWLEAKGVRVPGDVALAGFDDSREALRRGLTSVRFDAPMMARAMVRQVLTQTRERRTIHYEGTVVARGSTP